MKRHFVFAMLAAGSALLGGCWDDDDAADNPQATLNEVPDSALASSAAYTAYVGSLALSETAPPVDISKIGTAPSSETAPPAAL